MQRSKGDRSLRNTPKAVRRKGSAVTIDEVAAHAGVSAMTVSRVINGHTGVREGNRERVLRSVQELDYRPNLAASALAAAQQTCIALIYTNPSSSYLRELLVGALRGSTRAAVQLLIASWDELGPRARREAARSLASRVAGVILPPPLCESKAIVDAFVNAGIAVVAIASGHFSGRISCVRIDDRHASRDIVEHLIAQGHRRIGYIAGDPNQTASAQRSQGYRDALVDAGIGYDEALVYAGHFTYRSGLEAAQQLLSLPCPPSAIFASNDDMASAVVSVAHRRGLQVPGDLSVVGFDDTSASTMVWPEVTTIHQPVAEMADAAIDILLGEIRRTPGARQNIVNHVLPHQLVLRASVQPPGRP
ncbi:LacI family DNA-binding transcriptional regulator [Stenotrophomonas aracearum]|jgi:LacI family transcriptional regulator|uniref:LacI family DNA-binding transcriptional regulator n=1 Tax=Stenotrophomonas aracearum TaxID=3003272 RepID=A0ABY9Y8T0_9GAMM|nr:LacI family DNA-binding transcriptional regulator [Stenotrophomonas sp. A5588]WNH47056.1 LacI family DNA-binding transcriptional regulator [Stenotrophomonas sp. A5588]